MVTHNFYNSLISKTPPDCYYERDFGKAVEGSTLCNFNAETSQLVLLVCENLWLQLCEKSFHSIQYSMAATKRIDTPSIGIKDVSVAARCCT